MTTRPHRDPSRPLHAPVQVFALDEIAADTWAEAAGVAGHNAITLRKSANLRLVLMTMHAGSALAEHQTFAPIALQVISGRVRVTAADDTIDLSPHMIVTIDGGIAHRVDALEDAVCLLTLAGATNDD